MCAYVSVSPSRFQPSIGASVSTCCDAASPYITPRRRSTVCRLESLPRLPSQHSERSEALFFFLILLSAPAISARPPASHLIHSVTSFLLFSFLLPPPGSVFKIQPDFFVASMAFLGGLFCQLMLFAAFIVIDSCFCLSFSLLFSSPPRLHIP